MHFDIDAQGRRGLRVIEEIPDIDLCRLEGYNGIGKTSAVRLLQLCAGIQPYSITEGRTWRAFRNHLTSARVVATGLQGASRIEWVLEPSAWPDSPEPLGDRIGEIRIDGRKVRSQDLTDLLHVHRIAGDETFTETLASQAASTGVGVLNWIEPGGLGWDRLERLDHSLADVEALLTQYDSERIERFRVDRNTAENAQREAAEVRERRKAVEKRAQLLSEALQLADQLEEVRGRGPGLEKQLEDLEQQLARLETERERLHGEITAMGEREQRDKQAREEFQKAERLLGRRQAELDRARSNLSAISVRVGVPPDNKTISTARTAATTQLQQLLNEQSRVNRTPLVIDLAQELAARLRNAEESGLADELLVASTSERLELTVQQLRVGLQRQVVDRAAQEQTEESERIASEVEQARLRIQQIGQAYSASKEVAGAEDLLRRAEVRMQKASSALSPDTATALQSLLEARNRLEQQLSDLSTRRGQLQHARSLLGGGHTEETLTERLTAAARAAGVAPSALRAELTLVEQQLDQLRMAEADAQRRARHLEQQISEYVLGSERTIGILRQDPSYEWLRDTVALASAADRDIEERLRFLARLKDALDGSRNRLLTFRRQVSAIGRALKQLGEQLRGGAAEPNDWLRVVQLWLADEVGRWFDHDDVREALFPGGRDIRLDLTEMTVSWTADSELQTRPLHAFSSGEQVFAYTRARMARLDLADDGAANRLIVLDEFGAFMAADRMRRLAGYLQDRRERFAQDQIVVILPLAAELQVSPEDEDVLSSGIENGEMAERRRQLRKRGYFAERLTP